MGSVDRDLGVMGFGGSGIWGLHGRGSEARSLIHSSNLRDLGIRGLGSRYPGTGIWMSGDWDLGIWDWDEWIWGLGEARRPDP